MNLHGITKLTLLDVPKHIACTAFTGGCNFRCPYCQNAPLVLFSNQCESIPEEEFFAFLSSRKGKLEGVCVTGGEPTLQKDLLSFLQKIKEQGFYVKLDTNGYAPEILEKALCEQLVDMVAMDIKNSRSRYGETVGLSPDSFDLRRIEDSVSLLKQSKITHEFRTTVVKEFHDETSFLEIGEWLKGDSHYYLQSFVASDNLICGQKELFHAYSKEELSHFCSLLTDYLPNTTLRGID